MMNQYSLERSNNSSQKRQPPFTTALCKNCFKRYRVCDLFLFSTSPPQRPYSVNLFPKSKIYVVSKFQSQKSRNKPDSKRPIVEPAPKSPERFQSHPVSTHLSSPPPLLFPAYSSSLHVHNNSFTMVEEYHVSVTPNLQSSALQEGGPKSSTPEFLSDLSVHVHQNFDDRPKEDASKHRLESQKVHYLSEIDRLFKAAEECENLKQAETKWK